jgi:hypothetical protein
VSGVASFPNLRILSRGSFTITASTPNPGTVSSTSSALSIVNYVYTVAVSTSTDTPCANFVFTVTVTLRGEDTVLFAGSCVITLTAGSDVISGATSGVVNGYTGTFSVYFPVSGAKTVVATCPASGNSPTVSGSHSVTVASDHLLISSPTPTVRNT